jgi:hypothetical protein
VGGVGHGLLPEMCVSTGCNLMIKGQPDEHRVTIPSRRAN